MSLRVSGTDHSFPPTCFLQNETTNFSHTLQNQKTEPHQKVSRCLEPGGRAVVTWSLQVPQGPVQLRELLLLLHRLAGAEDWLTEGEEDSTESKRTGADGKWGGEELGVRTLGKEKSSPENGPPAHRLVLQNTQAHICIRNVPLASWQQGLRSKMPQLACDNTQCFWKARLPSPQP